MNNFRPVSNLSFISKVVERVVTSQLQQYLAENDLIPRFQSAYRKYHSIETAMQRVWSDILVAADDRQVTLLGLLDLSAVFDCVDHSMLLKRLQSAFGLTDFVHDWAQRSHFWPTERSRLPTVVNCLLCSRYYLGFRKDPHWARCCTFWAGPGRWPSWPQPAPVCRWHAGLHQHTGWWRWGCRPTSYCVSRRHRGMVEGQPTSTEPHQDPLNCAF